MKLITLYGEFLALQKQQIGTVITKSTFKTYVTRTNTIVEYLTKTDQLGIEVKDIRIKWIRVYTVWLRSQKGHCNDYVVKHIQLLGKLFNIAIEDEITSHNPVTLYKFKYDRKPDITYLEYFELKVLTETNMIPQHLIKAKDLYLFQCYTGLGYSDLYAFDSNKNIIKGFDEKDWIQIKRKKTSQESILPLLGLARNILEKYDYVLPRLTNQHLNRGLKVIFKIANIKKRITTHTARKTFANLMHNEFGVPKESVSRMIGHTSVKTTERWYCTTNMRKIEKDMKEVMVKMAS